MELTEGWSTIRHASNIRSEEKLHWFLGIKGIDDTEQTVCGNYFVPAGQPVYFMDVTKCQHCSNVLRSRS